MHGGKLDLQLATEISNDLHQLVPIGSLFFYGAPASGFSLANTSVGGSRWFWLDALFLSLIFGLALHPVLKALISLVSCRFLSAVYKATTISCSLRPMTVWKVRVYAIPLDIEGSRFIRLWRKQRFRNVANLCSDTKRDFHLLLCFLDFSAETWRAKCFPTLLPPAKVAIIPFTSTQSTMKASNLRHHMRRWVSMQPFSAGCIPTMSLDEVLQTVYHRIEAPRLPVGASRKSLLVKNWFSPEHIIGNLLDERSPSFLDHCGLKTTLYRFQIESLCRMYEKESFTFRDHVSNFVKMSSPLGHVYYYNTLNGEISRESELMTIPRGGILAENMGLGKTLICLALICMTKCEHSCIPENLLLYHDDRFIKKSPPSLFNLAKNVVLENLFWRHYILDLPPKIAEELSNSPATFSVYEDPQPQRSRAGRQAKPSVRTLQLCSTTLVVVPDNIIHQWILEVEKHLHDPSLKKLYIFDRRPDQIETEHSVFRNSLPTNAQHLLSYDIVLIGSNKVSKLSVDTDNVLMRIYWKRLIIDEGHSMSTRASNLSLMCKNLYAERRWAVSGTPTSGLTNLLMEHDVSMNRGSESAQEDASTDESPKRKKRKYVIKSKFNSKEDLRKLGNLVTSYFKIEPFASQPGLWSKTIVKELISPNQFAAQHSLQRILNNLMIRHTQPQVEKDIKLPPLHHEAVFIIPSYHNKLAINLFTSVLAVNAVTSEREGSDYMFDASNRKQLRALVNNLQLSTFYWTGFQINDVTSLLKVASEYLDRKTDQGALSVVGEDRSILYKSIRVAKTALQNPRWKIATTMHEMQYLVKGLDIQFTENYAVETLGGDGVYGGPQLLAAQRFFYKNRFKGSRDLADSLIEDSSKFWRHYWQDFEKKYSEKLSVKAKRTAPSNLSATDKEQADKCVLEDLKSRRILGNPTLSNSQTADPRKAQIVSTALAKLSYLICKLFDDHARGTKSIVFFDFEDHAYFLTEALDILGMQYLLYATFVGSKARAENLNAFSSRSTGPNEGICLIMDIKLASHGLNIIAATKVYFINPVWQQSVEAQAIKRAHRIGQTKEVYVETLILKGTLEEEIYRKRQADDPASQSNADPSNKHAIDDVGIQSFVLKHEFLPFDEAEEEYCPLVLLQDCTEQKTGTPSPDDSDDGFALPTHSRETVVSGTSRCTRWKMQLFSPDSLQKISEIDAKRKVAPKSLAL